MKKESLKEFEKRATKLVELKKLLKYSNVKLKDVIYQKSPKLHNGGGNILCI